ncbi:coiled-coil domain-containing protein [Crocinitomix algicola]|uniref:hypothetical protein n=1 Tax=Crocinitomix algicola TaxID=1740263 RepID=UPI000AECACBC|nr:hypothetical protein [Crocinitomix algicola]
MNKFQKLIEQIERFIKKFYKNEMLKGGVLVLIVLLLTYLTVTGLEYFGRFGSSMRLFLLLSFIVVNSYILVRYLIIPLLKLYKLGKHLSLLEAADMLGRIFPDVGDKLRNTLELKSDEAAMVQNVELVNASIEQRSDALSAIPFSGAIDLKENWRYGKFLIPVIILFVLVGVLNPNWFIGGSERVINFNTEFIEPAPFNFVLVSDNKAVEGENYKLQLKLVGEEIPNEVKIFTNKGNYNLKQSSNIEFDYEFVNLSEQLSFYCVANDYQSKNFKVDILKKPIIEDMKLYVSYPAHTGLEDEVFENSGDIEIPEGSNVKWELQSKNMAEVKVMFRDSLFELKSTISNKHTFSKSFFKSEEYQLLFSSDDIKNADSVNYMVGVIKDKFPVISVDEIVDSTDAMVRFFEGKISDDYGFTNLNVRMRIKRNDSTNTITRALNFSPRAGTQLFSFGLNLRDFNLKPGDELTYLFSVTDNDKINGFKSSATHRMKYAVPELDQLENQLGENDQKIKDNIDKATKDAKDLKEDVRRTKQELLNKPNLDWKDKQQLQNLIDKQNELKDNIEELKKDFDENKDNKEQFLENSDQLKQKQEELQKLMEELLDEELLDLFEELEKLLDEMNKDDIIENLEEMEMNSETLEEELDRTLELFKNMELDQKLENLEEQLNKLAEEEEALKEKSENKELTNEELSKEQERLNEKFNEIQKDIDEIEEKNDELERPRNMEFDQEMEDAIEKEMNESKDNLDKNKRKKSEENQSKASEMMKQMAESAQAMQSVGQQQQKKEDMEALRFLLENLITLSHDQEDLMGTYNITDKNDPFYLDLNRKQLAVSKATVVVKDSLIALSKRVFELSETINKELNDLSYNLDKSLNYSEDRKTGMLMQHQQYSMTAYNNLALLLSEVLDQMQNAMKNPMPGNGSCDNPGGQGQGKSGKKPSMQDLKQQLQDQINQMKGGKQPGGKEGKGEKGEGMGETPGSGSNLIPQLGAKERAKMAAEQGKLREGLKQLKQELNKDGSGAGNGLDEIIKDLEDLQNELLDGKVGSDYLKRQEDIYTRLLESEKALRERGYSEERESKEGKNTKEGNLKEFTEYNRKKDAEIEFLRTLPLELKIYYKSLINDYFNAVNKE